ncbi:hypothetical protein HBN50_06920 [Halobacteriovorax sp. GB3]|uniref:hypothetical protein n=1 Tax=Halobacteriovorax sp. GB3 TaxID=2719615 RepID=UPI0023624918|nr:hypothetical protein [Halobacteriovorax sp. GB3]MDD0852819.1 hypothetical protein [Halobacteriovorax sp. GB3]
MALFLCMSSISMALETRSLPVLILAPGLNLNPKALSELAQEFSTQYETHIFSIDYNQGSLAEWQQKVIDFIDHYKNRDLYFIGQSLGGLLFLDYEKSFKSMAFLSFPLALNLPGRLMCLMSKLPLWKSVPSFNYPNYRLHSFTNKSAYQGLCHLVDHLQFENHSKYLFIIDKEDELVDVSSYEKKGLSVSYFQKSPHNKYHHLLVDRFSLGDDRFQSLFNKISLHFRQVLHH